MKKSIIWLDSSVTIVHKENLTAQQVFRTLTSHLKTYTGEKECEKYIQSVSKYHRIILIVGGRLALSILPRTDQLQQVSIIFVYSMDRRYEQWTKTYKKSK